MERVKKGCHYFWIDYRDDFCILADKDWRQELSTARFERGNYFLSSDEANRMVSKLRAVLNGADVIEMPSEEECETFAVELARKNAFVSETFSTRADWRMASRMTVDWLKSKIAK